ncbi:MAG: TIGR00269 family protein [Promethearchaeota archaeon]
MKNCKKCGRSASIHLPMYRLNLCSDHFFDFIRNKMKKIIQKYKLINPYERVAVALSGGKDSTVLLHLLNSIYSETLDLIGLHINLGITPVDYSKNSYQLAKELCNKLDREFVCVDLRKQYRISMDLVKENEKSLKRPLCSICGIFKRYLLNRYSLKLNCDKLATGHVRDDEASVLLMNIFRGNTEHLIRTGPNLIADKTTMITRIKPLYEISEQETIVYAQFGNLNIQDGECPYSKGALSIKYKKFFHNFETDIPGIENIFLQNFNKKILVPLKEYYQKPNDRINRCIQCDGPTSKEICAFCKIKKILIKNK